MEHEIWIGKDYLEQSEKYFIIGHSHYCNEEEAGNAGFTRKIVNGVIEKGWPIAFFTAIQRAFDEDRSFWNKVLFFNYLPRCVGDSTKKFDAGDDALILQAESRFCAAIRTLKPDRIFAFTHSDGKGWPTFPKTIEEEEEKNDRSLKRLGQQYPDRFEWGTYDVVGKLALACGIRHPLFAKDGMLSLAVADFKQVPLPDPLSYKSHA